MSITSIFGETVDLRSRVPGLERSSDKLYSEPADGKDLL